MKKVIGRSPERSRRIIKSLGGVLSEAEGVLWSNGQKWSPLIVHL